MLMKRTKCLIPIAFAVIFAAMSLPISMAVEAKSRPLKLPGLRLLSVNQEPTAEVARAVPESNRVLHQSLAGSQPAEQSTASVSTGTISPGSDAAGYAPGSTVASFNQSGALSIGRILVKPSAAISYAYESNLQALSAGYQPDRTLLVAPTIEAFIPLLRNGVRLEYSMLYRDYQRFSLKQHFDHTFNVDSVLDISPILSVAVRDHFAMSAVNAQEYTPGRELLFSDSRFTRNDLGLQVNWALSENDSLGLSADWNRIFFAKPDDNSESPFFDYSQYLLGIGYKRDISEKFGIFTKGNYRQSVTDDPRGVSDSRGFDVMTGLEGALTPLIRAQLGVGFRFDRYPGSATRTATGLTLSGNLVKEISERSQVSLSLSRGSNLSNFQENAYFTTTGAGISYNREIRQNLGAYVSSGYQRNGYPLPLQPGYGVPIDLVGRDTRKDSFVDFGIGALYRYNDWLAMDVRFDLTRRYSDLPQFSYQSYRAIINFLIGSKGSAGGRAPF